ncbi:TerC family protein [Desulfosudis oleivorans]|uniref:Integral membrane protein TerC n=1 Tax=Desulfosudis oleivorans (strain DSM 6200 / JCM 39069 / Hxd3) TaxID=96561 RepID=A8ZS65_DESOH|nr:TerC family protein [Desulfosudis oleivorans]ABW66083.1 Integral membrane protein TerC [Desulfosudis oleivorans Hxd3]
MEHLADPNIWLALTALTALEIVLGIDNIVFIAILAGRLPEDQQAAGRRVGLALALITRILLLFSLTWIMRLTAPLFSVLDNPVSGRDIILIAGGLFLLAKSTVEIHAAIEGEADRHAERKGGIAPSFFSVVTQIMVLDIVFSLDSVITAIGLAQQIWVMVTAIVIAVGVMIVMADMVSAFIEKHPTVKMLALSFLLLVGLALIGDGVDLHIPRGYIYFAMGFSVFVEVLNLRIRGRKKSAA